MSTTEPDVTVTDRPYLLGFGALGAVVLALLAGLVVTSTLGRLWALLDVWLFSSGVGAPTRLAVGSLILAAVWLLLWWSISRPQSAGVSSAVVQLRYGRGHSSDVLRVFLWFAGVSILYLMPYRRPETTAYQEFFGENPLGWWSLFQGTPRWWIFWAVSAATAAVLFLRHRRAPS